MFAIVYTYVKGALKLHMYDKIFGSQKRAEDFIQSGIFDKGDVWVVGFADPRPYEERGHDAS